MTTDDSKSLSDDVTFAGKAAARPQRADVSLGDERTLGGGNAVGNDTIIADIEVVDLEARYRVEGTLGQGGMGAVLLATDTRLDRKVAIKRILGEAAGNRMAVQRFLTEAKSIAALNHPNIVQIYDYGRAKDGPFLIMEYVDGGSLLDLCKQGAVALDKAVDLVSQVCSGLGIAHEQGIIHRDIKPANILINKAGLPKLTDFGLAKAEANDHGMTMTGAVMGTPDFMPPEQRRDASEVDARSDLWSLAATLYQAVTGRSPKIIRFDLLPASLTKVLGKALEDEKAARYQSAREFRDALSAAVTGQSKPTAAVAVEAVEGSLQEGQCKACGTVTSDLAKKFCRNPQCGASLRVACLKCEAQMPVWDGVCGECGGNQPTLVEARRKSLNARRAEAERLAAALQFDAAVKCAKGITAESRPEFADIVAWVPTFVAATTEEFSRRRTAVEQSLKDAQRHVDACDYSAAIHTVEAIPEPLRDARSDGVLSECRALHQESEGLIAEIAARVGRKETAGLLPLVERAAELRTDRLDLAKMWGQLRERRDRALTRVNAALDIGDVRQAAAAITGFTAEDLGQGGAELIARIERASALESKLVKAIAAAKADGTVTTDELVALSQMVGECLAVIPTSPKLLTLRDQIRTQLQDRQQRRDAVLARVKAALDVGDVRQAAAALAGFTAEDLGQGGAELIARVERASALESKLVKAIAAAKADGTVTTDELINLSQMLGDCLTLIPESPKFRPLRDHILSRIARNPATFSSRIVELRPFLKSLDPAALQSLPAVIRDSFVATAHLVVCPKCGVLIKPTREQWHLANRCPGQKQMQSSSQGLIRNSIGIELKRINPGTFIMGDAGGGEEETPHQVTLTTPFYMGVNEVTNAQWKQVMGSVPSRWKDDDRPVTNVSWEDAVEFCRKLSALPEERTAGRIYRLPTEAEWEYACRAGTTTAYSFGDNASQLVDYAWYGDNSGKARLDAEKMRLTAIACQGISENSGHEPVNWEDIYAANLDANDCQTHPAGHRKPNPWGLYDMHGNVYECCSDWYGEYETCSVTDPQGPSSGSARVYRGGSWAFTAKHCRSGFRNGFDPSLRDDGLGFRVAMSPTVVKPLEADK